MKFQPFREIICNVWDIVCEVSSGWGGGGEQKVAMFWWLRMYVSNSICGEYVEGGVYRVLTGSLGSGFVKFRG